jgi:hypothetical protein
MLNALDIDPKNLEFDFGRDWTTFQSGRVCTFLALFLQMQIGKLCRALETAATLEDMKELQGQIAEARHLLTVLGLSDAKPQVLQVVEFLKTTYGR